MSILYDGRIFVEVDSTGYLQCFKTRLCFPFFMTFSSVHWPKLLASVLVCELAGVLGALFTAPAIGTWYASLVKPVFVPPSWLFGPVWVVLYALMGAALYLVLVKGEKENVGVGVHRTRASTSSKKGHVLKKVAHPLPHHTGSKLVFGHLPATFLALSVFGFQLVLNVLWSVLFFGLHSPFLGFVAIVVLLLAAVDTARLFFGVSRAAGLLLFPYVVWTAFATVLNFAIWRLN